MATDKTPPAAAGTELATITHSSTDLASLQTLKEILLTGELNVEIVDDPNEISRQMVAQLLAAPDDEALQSFGNAEPWGDYLDVPMELHGFHWRKSEIEGEGSPIYFIVATTNMNDGERKVLTTGSMSVLAQLTNMAERGTLVGGVWMQHKSEKPTRAGFYPQWLVQPDAIKAAARAAREPASAAS
jgi:hypothetical protein